VFVTVGPWVAARSNVLTHLEHPPGHPLPGVLFAHEAATVLAHPVSQGGVLEGLNDVLGDFFGVEARLCQ